MYEGWTVPMDYDPLLAKLIGYGSDREQAIARLTRALNEYFVGGIKTNISLFRRILHDADFRAAKVDTGFLDRMLKRAEDKLRRLERCGGRGGSSRYIRGAGLNRGCATASTRRRVVLVLSTSLIPTGRAPVAVRLSTKKV